jgi:hypothetical protein
VGRIRKQSVAADKAAAAQITWRIAVYLRLSREDGGEESGSVTNQKKILQEYLKNFFEGQYVIADFYVDDGLSGTDDSRADFMRLIQDIEQGKVNCMLCKTLSRAFRNYADQGYYLEYYFPQKNVRFVSTGDPKVDTYTNPEAITGLEVPITGLMNDRYAAKTSSDIRRTFATKRRNGEFIGAFPPYGYLKNPEDKNHLILDDAIVPIKRDMLYWIIRDGMSLGGAARRLNELGIPNPTAYKRGLGWKYRNPKADMNDGMWTGSTVRKILLDKVNLGHMVQGKQRVVSYKVHDRITVPEEDWFIKENTHDPTFSLEEYDTLARLLARDTRTANGARTVRLFSGFMRCHDCGKALQRTSSKGNAYYFCRTYKEKSKEKCAKHAIREDRLCSMVLASVQAQIALLEAPRDIVEEIDRAPFAGAQSLCLEKLLKDRQRALEKTRSLSDNLYVAWQSGDITREDHRRMKTKFEEQIVQIAASIAALKEEQQRMGQGVDSGVAIFAAFLKHRNIRQLDRNVLAELVNAIFVHENTELTIVFRFADELARAK